MPHRQHFTHFIKRYLSFPTNRLCNTCFKTPSSHQTTHPPSALPHRSKNPRHYRSVGCHLAVSWRSLRTCIRQSREQRGGTREFVVGVWGAVSAFWEGYFGLLAWTRRAVGCAGEKSNKSRMERSRGSEGFAYLQYWPSEWVLALFLTFFS